ncbi:MAG TPA: ABC transporter permease [Candidatus Polarisedimenticolia bacterium]|jgi:ABC-2 type transport system permease protein
MRRILVLVLKDLRRRLADPAGFFLNLSIPLAMAGMMALAFGNSGGGEQNAPQLRLVLVDLDESPISGMLAGASQNPRAAGRMAVRRAATREEGLDVLRDEEFAAMLVIPRGFGQALLGSERTELELVKNPSENIMPVVAQQGAEVLALYLSAGARVLGDEGPRLQKLLVDGAGWNDAAGLGSMIATLYDRVDAAGNLLFPPIIEVTEQAETKQDAGGGFNWMSWMFPGMVVMGLLFTSLTQMRDLLRERDAGTLRRQLASPLGAGQVILAKVLSVAAVVAIALVLLLTVGSLAFGLAWGAPAPLIATSALLVLAITGFSAMVFALVRTERQGDAFGGVLTMLMSMVGGAFIPPQILPEWLRGVSCFTVNHWGHEALRALATGGGWAQVGAYLPALAIMGVVFTGLGMTLLGRRHLRGTL